jgi:glucose/arabinose dehydrogenase
MKTRGISILATFVLIVSAMGFVAKGSGIKTRALCGVLPGYWEKLSGPEVMSSKPGDGEGLITVDGVLLVNFKSPNGSLDAGTITPANVVLLRTRDQQMIKVKPALNSSGTTLVVKPVAPLAEKTQYTLVLTAGITDQFGKALRPCEISSMTAGKADPSLRFTKIALPTTEKVGFTCVVMSPFSADRTLYAASDDGRIFRFPVLADGTLGAPKVIDSLMKHEKGPRVLTGFCFDPISTAENPIVWASHGWGGFQDVPDFSGKISRISGRDLENVQDVVIHLPRSVKDHMNNQPAIGPDGALYWCQPSNSAYGDADAIWGMREEHLLTATVLRLDLKKWTPGQVIDVKTKDAGGLYDPFVAGAPLTIYAYGVRLGYDLLWHSNGQLYVPVNGSSAGGNSPGCPGVPALKNIPLDENDWLFRIKPGRYYGHPNPTYSKFVVNGGNPTEGYDFGEMPLYSPGTKPDADWERASYVFGRHVSANGVIEYKDATFGGKLDKTIMVCRYNFGSDIIVLHLDPAGNIIGDDCEILGLGGLRNPLDLTEDPQTGNLYVSEYGSRCITLLRANAVTQASRPRND